MNNRRLRQVEALSQKQLLVRVVGRRSPQLMYAASGIASGEEVSHDAVELIVEELGSEFLEFGLEPNDEPNAYGLEIEDLQDTLLRIIYG